MRQDEDQVALYVNPDEEDGGLFGGEWNLGDWLLLLAAVVYFAFLY